MEIKKIEDAKKYIDKFLYFIDTSEKTPTKLCIGGVMLFYNQVNYKITGFATYEDIKCTNYWGEVKLEDIQNKFDEKTRSLIYTFSSELANQYLVSQKLSDKEFEKKRSLEEAKRLLDEHNIKYEIFD